MKDSWKKLVRLGRALGALRVSVYASHASFFIALSLFPMLVLLLSLLRYTGVAVENLTELLHGIIPTALMPAAQKLIVSTYQSTTGTVISLSALTALWSASRGIYGLTAGLNAVYGVTERRGYFRTRLLSMVYTFGFLLVLLLTLILHVFGTDLLPRLPLEETPFLLFLESLLDMRIFLLLCLQTGLFAAMFMVLPCESNGFLDSVPGAVLASVCWLGFSELYSIYVERFAGRANVFGSVYAVALSMLWLYCCISIVFYGGALNRYLQRRTPDGNKT